MKKHLVQSHVLPGLDSVITFSYLDWATMSLFNAKMTKIQHSSLAETIRLHGGSSFGLVLLPTLTYRKGLLYKMESEAQSAIHSCGVFIDRSICLHFTEQAEHRVEWPLLMKGTLALPDDDATAHTVLKSVVKIPVLSLSVHSRAQHIWL